MNKKKELSSEIKSLVKQLNKKIQEGNKLNLEVFLKLGRHDELLPPTIQERISY